jgi:uncharacterized membrane protein YphA (DoxX/SURF4 family)
VSAEAVLAHVEYVVREPGRSLDPIEFLIGVLSAPMNAGLMTVGGAMTVGTLIGYLYVYETAPLEVAMLRESLTEDATFLPWLLRLSVGLPLVGAGFAGYFISPALGVPNDPAIAIPTRLFLVGVGFLLLFGIATRAAAIAGLLAYTSVTLTVAPQLLLASEYLGGFLAIVLLGPDQPSVDRLLARLAETEGTRYTRLPPMRTLRAWTDRHLDPYAAYTPTVVRLGVGFNFVYTGLFDKLTQPAQALAVVEQYQLTRVVPVDPGLWVVGAGITELALGIALIVGLFTRGVAAIAFGMFTLTLFALPGDPVLAHVSLFGLATALLITGSGRLALDNL